MRRCAQSSFYVAGVKLGPRQARWTAPDGVEYWVVPGRATRPDERSVHDLPDGAVLVLATLAEPLRRRGGVDELPGGGPRLPFSRAAAWGRAGQRALDLEALTAGTDPRATALLLHHATAALAGFPTGSRYATVLADAWLAHARALPSSWALLDERLPLVLAHCSPAARAALVAEVLAAWAPDAHERGTVGTFADRMRFTGHLPGLLAPAAPAERAALVAALTPELALCWDGVGTPALKLLAPFAAAATDPVEAAAWRAVCEHVVALPVDQAQGAIWSGLVQFLPPPGPVLSAADWERLLAQMCDQLAGLVRTESSQGLFTAAGLSRMTFAKPVARHLGRFLADLPAAPRARLEARLTGDPFLADLLAWVLVEREDTPVAPACRRAFRAAVLASGDRGAVVRCTAHLPELLGGCADRTEAAGVLTDLARVPDELVQDAFLAALPGVVAAVTPDALAGVLAELVDAVAADRYRPAVGVDRAVAVGLATTLLSAPVATLAWSDPDQYPALLERAIAGATPPALHEYGVGLRQLAPRLDDRRLARVVRALDAAEHDGVWMHHLEALLLYPRLAGELDDLQARLDWVFAHRSPYPALYLADALPTLFPVLSDAQLDRTMAQLVGYPDEGVARAASRVARDVFAEIDLRRVRAAADGELPGRS